MVMGDAVEETEIVVLGAGPGGYTAALRAAELGMKVTLVDARATPGGVCLHEGCIPSKALLHAAEVINTSKSATEYGLDFGQAKINLDKLRSWKESITDKLASGITAKCKSSKVEVIAGKGYFEDSKTLKVDSPGENTLHLKFKKAILATGSEIIYMPRLFKNTRDRDSKRIIDSRGALNIEEIPSSLLIVGGGYIGLEMGSVYAALGSKVTVVEMTDGLLPGVDRDLVKPLATRLQSVFSNIYLETKVMSLEDKGDSVECVLSGKDVPEKLNFDRVLVAVGRKPNSSNIGLENTQVTIDNRGFVKVDQFCQTSDPRILAIGDITGEPMLAHRAIRQGFVAAEVLAHLPSAFDNQAIPKVVFTEPEIAWCGLSETEAKANGQEVGVAKFPWSASGRAYTLGEIIGHTKVIYTLNTMQVVGIGIVGARAGELIAEGVLAIEMGALLEDLQVTIHPHPTLSETISDAATIGIRRAERQKVLETVEKK
jgi:dihydrolipoamide dehydrogenase